MNLKEQGFSRFNQSISEEPKLVHPIFRKEFIEKMFGCHIY